MSKTHRCLFGRPLSTSIGDCVNHIHWQRFLAGVSWLSLFFAFTLCFSSVIAQTTSPLDVVDANDPVAQWKRYYEQVADKYQLTVGVESPRELKRVQEPILSYTNPVSGRQQHGLIYVWSDRGRPAALGSIWSILYPSSSASRITSHEMLSLSESALRVIRPGLDGMRPDVPKQWVGKSPSVTWNALPRADLIGNAESGTELSSAQVRRMLRRAAARFEGESIRASDRSRTRLRLLRTPIFQYESDSQMEIGCLFTLADATDPEIVLWLEYVRPQQSNPTARSGAQWRYTAARMSVSALNLKMDGNQVWSQPPAVNRSTPTYNVQFRVRDFPDGRAPTN